MEEHIKKLNQLDRIEYRVRESDISTGFGIGMILAFVIPIFSISLAMFLTFMSLLTNSFEDVKIMVVFYIVAGVLFSVIMFLSTLFSYFLGKKKLNKEYFEIIKKK